MKRQRKAILMMLACALLLSGCGGAEETGDAYRLTARAAGEEAQDLKDLMGPDTTVQLYDYQVDESCRTLEIWLSEYDGENALSSERMRFASRVEEPSGSIGLALVPGEDGADTWRLLHANGASRSIYEANMDAAEITYGTSAQSGPPAEDRTIVLEEPMALHVIVYGEDSVSIYNLEEYDRDPARALDARKAVVLWCRFSADPMDDEVGVIFE